MTTEEKNLLLKDLCSRLPYGVKVKFAGYSGREDCTLNAQHLNSTYSIEYLHMKPYLRPMSSMTEKERNEYLSIKMQEIERVALAEIYRPEAISEIMDWLNANHFDYRGLIPMGLAIEAPEGMYKTKTE